MTDRIRYTPLTPITSDAQVRQAVNNIINNLIPITGQHSTKEHAAVTWLDLLNAGYNLKIGDDGHIIMPSPPEPEKPDMSTPPAVESFSAVAAFNNIVFSWQQPSYKNHSHVELWRADGFKGPEDARVPTVLDDAVFRLMAPSIMASDSVLPSDEFRYWARNVSKTGVFGPWTSVDGLLVSVPESPSYLIDKISGEIREGDLYPALGDKIDFTYNGVNKHTVELIAHQTELQKHTTELQNHADNLLQHGTVLAQHSNSISANGAAISQQGVIIADHTSLLSQHTTQITQNGNSITEQGRILTTHESTLVSHSRTLATQNAAISDLRTITETHGETLLSHSQSLTTQGGSINELKTITQTHDSLLLQHTNQISTANANITSISQIVDSQGNTLAEHTQTLSSHGTAIQQQASINTAQGALINAAWTVRIDSGNAVSGFGLMVDGATGRSDFIVRADRFAIAAPQAYDQNGKPVVNTNAFPFIVDVTNPAAPKTLIKNAYIDKAFIESLVTGSLVSDVITGQLISGAHIRGGDMAIGNNFNVDSAGSLTALNAFIRGTMQSENFGSGTTGWQINNNGNAEFNNAVVRGTGYFTDGVFEGTVYADRIVGDVYSAKDYRCSYNGQQSGVISVFRVKVNQALRYVRVLTIPRMSAFVGVTAIANGFAVHSTAVMRADVLFDGVVVKQFTFSVSAGGDGGGGNSPPITYSAETAVEIGDLTIPYNTAPLITVNIRLTSVNAPTGTAWVRSDASITTRVVMFKEGTALA